MKRIFLTLALCGLILVSGCGTKDKTGLPKSITIYRQLNLTPEQNTKLDKIRETQRQKMETIRKEMEENRVKLISSEATAKLTEAQKQENFEKYRTASNKMREDLAAQRVAYDEAFLGILDNDQQKVYKKYLKQREKEKIEREKAFKKQAAKQK